MSNTDSPVVNIQAKSPKHWSGEEDTQLCCFYIKIFVDSVHGTDQPIERMWKPVLLVGGITEDIRERQSIPWCRSFVVFSSKLKIVTRAAATLKECLSRRTYELYASTVGRSFKFHHYWSILRHEQKWKRLLEPKPKLVAASTPFRHHAVDNSGQEEEGDEEEACPIGRKRAKKAVQEKIKTAELFEMLQERNGLEDGQAHEQIELLRAIELELHAANVLKKKEQEMKQRRQDMKELTIDMSTLQNEEMVAFFLEEQKETWITCEKTDLKNNKLFFYSFPNSFYI
ncbi:unnamed protein product [Rhizopus stolonifer]